MEIAAEIKQSWPKVSIITPVYKAEKYLCKCIESIIAQSFQDWELLLIDDGSPDESGKICDYYGEKDSRIRVFHKDNGGVSSARQYGLDNATGDYVIHVDPDDWVESDMLEALLAIAIKENADMVICDFFVNHGECQIYSKQCPSSLDHNTVLCELFQQLHGSCWNKFVRRTCYSNFNISFPQNFSFCEDLYVNASLLIHNLNISYLPKAFYHYVTDINENSIVHKYDEKIQQEDMLLFSSINKLLTDNISAQSLARKKMAYIITLRAFYASTETAYSFYKKFHTYAFDIIYSTNNSLFMKCLLFCSCIGFYPFAKAIYRKRIIMKNKERSDYK